VDKHRQTDEQTDSNVLPTATNRVGVGNNNNNLYGAVVVTKSCCESSTGSSDESRSVPSGFADPQTKLTDLSREFACVGCYRLHAPLLFIVTSQPDTQFTVPRRADG